jgi:hypothetical protein
MTTLTTELLALKAKLELTGAKMTDDEFLLMLQSVLPLVVQADQQRQQAIQQHTGSKL